MLPLSGERETQVKYTKFKTKVICTVGIYFLVWRHDLVKGLRDDFGLQLDPGRELLLAFLPIIGLVRWHFILTQVKALEERAGITKVISPMRGLFPSGMWFGGGPYVNKHLNALYETRGAVATAAFQPMQAPAY
jgi:hypothetical protein